MWLILQSEFMLTDLLVGWYGLKMFLNWPKLESQLKVALSWCHTAVASMPLLGCWSSVVYTWKERVVQQAWKKSSPPLIKKSPKVKSEHLKRSHTVRRFGVKKVLSYSVAKWIGQVKKILLRILALISWHEEFICNYLCRSTESRWMPYINPSKYINQNCYLFLFQGYYHGIQWKASLSIYINTLTDQNAFSLAVAIMLYYVWQCHSNPG